MNKRNILTFATLATVLGLLVFVLTVIPGHQTPATLGGLVLATAMPAPTESPTPKEKPTPEPEPTLWPTPEPTPEPPDPCKFCVCNRNPQGDCRKCCPQANATVGLASSKDDCRSPRRAADSHAQIAGMRQQ